MPDTTQGSVPPIGEWAQSMAKFIEVEEAEISRLDEEMKRREVQIRRVRAALRALGEDSAAPQRRKERKNRPMRLQPETLDRVVAALADGAVNIAEIGRACHLAHPVVARALDMLREQERVRRTGNGTFALMPDAVASDG